MTPAKRERLRTIYDQIRAWQATGDSPKLVIANLQGQHGATWRYTGGTYVLRLATIAVSCTAGEHGAVDAWLRKATLEIMKANAAS